MVLLRSGEPPPGPGRSVPAARLLDLARGWYGDRLDPGWRPRTREASQQILADAGLLGAFWRLPA